MQTSNNYAEELRRNERERAIGLFLTKAKRVAEKILKTQGEAAAREFLREAKNVAEIVGKTAGDRAAATYLAICSRPAPTQKDLDREIAEMEGSNADILLAAMSGKEWWKTTELMRELGWGHKKTSQTTQYLIRKGKIVKSGSGNRVQYRKAGYSDRGVA